MNASFLNCSTIPTPPNSTFFHHPKPVIASFNPSLPSRNANKTLKISSKPVPARDRVMEFGKHKGKMLGTLPSTYLKWVSNNLRARDFEEWANLADEVLSDPIYKDRIEWEYADKVLNGNAPIKSDGGAVAELLEISQRYGWDNEDKAGWSRVDFGLLGTSNGGRIPRVSSDGREMKSNRAEVRTTEEGEGKEDEDRRRERRERLKMKMKMKMKRGDELGFGADEKKGVEDDDDSAAFGRNRDRTVEIRSRFPGRESLLKKVMRNRNRPLE